MNLYEKRGHYHALSQSAQFPAKPHAFFSDDDPMHYDLLPADAVRIRSLPGLYAGTKEL